ncbi:MAG TPA: hypothetical protein VGE94_00045, partial [Chloroflexota bacterium]
MASRSVLSWSLCVPLVGFAAIAGCLAIDAALVRVGLDDLDEGYFAEQALRVLRGDLPYRDFEALYTPGLLYLHAGLFAAAGGPTLVGMRLASLLARALLAAAMFGLGRSLMPGRWAVWPPLLLLVGLDTIPAGWEPHPGWYAALMSLVAVWLFARVPQASPRQRRGWLAATGAAVALTFLFKQNVGVLIGLAVVVFTVLQGFDVRCAAVTPAVRKVQLATVAFLLGLVVWLVHPFVDVTVALLIVSPTAISAALLLKAPVDERGSGVWQRLVALVPFGVGFWVVTACWLAVLLFSLEFQVGRLGSFVGAVDQSTLYFPLQLPGPIAFAALGPPLFILAAIRLGGWRRPVLALAAASMLAPVVWLTRLPDEVPLASVLLAPERVSVGLISVLPAVAAWSAAWLARRQPGSVKEWRLRWYLIAGALAWLGQYPRMDTFHLAWSTPLLLVLGVAALGHVHARVTLRWTSGRLRSVAVALALLSVPVSAALPGVYLRAGVLFESDAETGWPTRTWLVPLTQPPIVDGFRLGAAAAWQLRDLLAYLDTATAPGEP